MTGRSWLARHPRLRGWLAAHPNVKRGLKYAWGRCGAGSATSTNGRAREYWDEHMDVSCGDWTSNPLVQEVVNRRIVGPASNDFWLNWVLADYLPSRVRRCLSICCGTGTHEIIAAKTGRVGFLEAFDLSPRGVDAARRRAADAGVEVRFFEADVNAYECPRRSYDLILAGGALHHVSALERVLATLHDGLTDDGVLIANEFVGPVRHQWTERQVETVNRLLGALPPHLRARSRIERSSVEEMLAHDPSEAVRSSLILPVLRSYFEIVEARPFGGTLMHVLYQALDPATLESPEARAALGSVLATEESLIGAGVLPSDFALVAARRRGGSGRVNEIPTGWSVPAWRPGRTEPVFANV